MKAFARHGKECAARLDAALAALGHRRHRRPHALRARRRHPRRRTAGDLARSSAATCSPRRSTRTAQTSPCTAMRTSAGRRA
jgi:hypothetical protein